MTDKLQTLINAHRYGAPQAKYHYGDMALDTVAALEELQVLRAEKSGFDDVRGEVAAQLPEEDELSEIIDVLRDGLDMSKDGLLQRVHEVLDMLEVKQAVLGGQTDYALSLLR